MARLLRITLIAVVVLTAVTTGALALVSGLPEADTYVDFNARDTSQNGNDLRIQGSSGAGGGCDPVRTVYMRWSLTGLTQAPGYAKLQLITVGAGSSNAGGRFVTLYQLADSDDGWDESLTYNTPAPGVGAAIQTVSLPGTDAVPAGTVITFGDADTGLLTYLQQEYNSRNKIASFALRFTTCAATSIQWFEDRESGASGPYLEVRLTPTAVALSTFAADNPAPAWPLIAGLGALAALISAAGVWIYRKRAAMRL